MDVCSFGFGYICSILFSSVVYSWKQGQQKYLWGRKSKVLWDNSNCYITSWLLKVLACFICWIFVAFTCKIQEIMFHNMKLWVTLQALFTVVAIVHPGLAYTEVCSSPLKCEIVFWKLQWTFLDSGWFEPVLGGYHIFMIPTGSGFHKTIYERVQFFTFFFLKFICRARVYIYKLVLNMLVFEILRTAGSPLQVLTNWVLLINWLLLLKISWN
jgi:hypothetical protein